MEELRSPGGQNAKCSVRINTNVSWNQRVEQQSICTIAFKKNCEESQQTRKKEQYTNLYVFKNCNLPALQPLRLGGAQSTRRLFQKLPKGGHKRLYVVSTENSLPKYTTYEDYAKDKLQNYLQDLQQLRRRLLDLQATEGERSTGRDFARPLRHPISRFNKHSQPHIKSEMKPKCSSLLLLQEQAAKVHKTNKETAPGQNVSTGLSEGGCKMSNVGFEALATEKLLGRRRFGGRRNYGLGVQQSAEAVRVLPHIYSSDSQPSIDKPHYALND